MPVELPSSYSSHLNEDIFGLLLDIVLSIFQLSEPVHTPDKRLVVIASKSPNSSFSFAEDFRGGRHQLVRKGFDFPLLNEVFATPIRGYCALRYSVREEIRTRCTMVVGLQRICSPEQLHELFIPGYAEHPIQLLTVIMTHQYIAPVNSRPPNPPAFQLR